MTVYIIFTINILHFCFKILEYHTCGFACWSLLATSSIYFTSQSTIFQTKQVCNQQSLLFLVTVWHNSCRVIQFWKLVFAGAFKDHPIFDNYELAAENLCFHKPCYWKIATRRYIISKHGRCEKDIYIFFFFFALKTLIFHSDFKTIPMIGDQSWASIKSVSWFKCHTNMNWYPKDRKSIFKYMVFLGKWSRVM